MRAFLDEKIRSIGTSACPPYHLAIVIGGLSAEQTLKTVKLTSCRYLDSLPTSGNVHGRAFRDLEMEQEVLEMTRNMGIGAQFGGKYFCHDVRVVRLPRHGASLPVGIGVSCSADRQALAVINKEGGTSLLPRKYRGAPAACCCCCFRVSRQLLRRCRVSLFASVASLCAAVFLEQLEMDPTRFLPSVTEADLGITEPVRLSLNQPMSELLKALQQLPCKTRLSLSGTLIVARDIAHSKLLERLQKDGDLPDYFKNHPIYYAGQTNCLRLSCCCAAATVLRVASALVVVEVLLLLLLGSLRPLLQ